MTASQREEVFNIKLLVEADKKAEQIQKSLHWFLAGIGAANYQVLEFILRIWPLSTVSAFSSLVGVTLPFAFYTGMSSAIGIRAIGPHRFITGAFPLYKTFKMSRSGWQILQEKGLEMYKGLKYLATGNAEAFPRLVFTYFAGMRILKEEDYERKY